MILFEILRCAQYSKSFSALSISGDASQRSAWQVLIFDMMGIVI